MTNFRKKILITGASGFIGSFLVEESLRQNLEVYAGIRATSSKLFLQHENIRTLELDFSSRENLTRQLGEHIGLHGPFEYIIHNAGTTGTKGASDFMKVNYQYTQYLVDALSGSGRLTGKFLYISSLAAHGPGNPQTYDPISMTFPDHPVTTYGKSKVLAEQYIRSRVDFPYVILRPTAVYGPRDRDFLQFFKLVKRGIEPYLGRHRQMISMIYVKDFARASIQLLQSPAIRATYIASDGLSYEKEQLGSILRSILGTKTFRFKIPLLPLRIVIGISEKLHKLFGKHPFISREKLDEISESNWLCDSRPLWETLHTCPEYSLEQGLAETAVWYQKQGWL